MGRKLFALVITAGFLVIVSPLALPVLMGALFAVLLQPPMDWLREKHFRSRIASLLITLGVTALVILPLSLLFYLMIKTGLEQLQALRSAPAGHKGAVTLILEAPAVQRLLHFAQEWFPGISEDQVQGSIQDLLGSISVKSAELLGAIITRLPGFVLDLVIVVVSIYFFLIDGQRLVRFFRQHSFFSPLQTEQLITALANTCRSVVMAALVVGVSQSAVFSVASIIAGLPSVAVVGFLVFVSSFVPVVGIAPVTLGLVLQQFFAGNTGSGLILLAGAVLAMSIDNVVRPLFLQGSVNLHPLLAFVAAFGGLATLGFSGIFFGPVVAALFVVTVQILTTDDEMTPPEQVA